MGLLIGLLTVVMVLDCLVLIFLVLMQLPKKEAGAGLAFGAGATDALFGAGSGNFLTKITKYAAGTFFVLAIVLSIMQSRYHTRNAVEFQEKLNTTISTPAAEGRSSAPAPATAPKPALVPTSVSTNSLLTTPLSVESTNVTAPAGTNK